jgi:hypothetical protein
MREAWWVPMVNVWDHEDGPRLPWLVNRERTRPHSIIVNRAGRRFTNEAVNDNAFGSAFHEMHTTSLSYVNRPAWLLFDQHYAVTYGLAGRFRGRAGAGLAHPRTDPAALAGRLGIPGGNLEDTVARWNAICGDGDDPEGGPRTTGEGQVIDVDGAPITGLYAAGNAMASPMGMTYGGAGGTLAPGMVFGFLAARHAARR